MSSGPCQVTTVSTERIRKLTLTHCFSSDFQPLTYSSTLAAVTTSTPESTIGDAGIRPALMSARSRTDSPPHPKYFWPRSTCTLPALSRSGAGGMVSNEITLVCGGTLARALRVNTGQPPTEIQAPRSGYRFVPDAM